MATLCKIVLAGGKNSGKTSLLRHFGDANLYPPNTTLNSTTKSMTVGGRTLNVELRELLEHRGLILNAFDQRTKGALVVYDVTSRQSYIEAQNWVRDLRRVGRIDMVIMLVGNKSDLKAEVSTQEARQYAELDGLLFIETSALNGTNADLVMDVLLSQINNLILSSLVDLKKSESSRCY